MSPGAPSVFSGAMASTITRKVKYIDVLADAVFEVLTFQFNGGEAQQVGPETVTYPSLFTIREVASFKLDSGTILVYFSQGK
jgi:hypothetical protein